MKHFFRACYLGWLATIIVMSLMPNPPVPEVGFLAWDKFQHATAYALLTILGGLSFTISTVVPAGRWLVSMTIAVVTGGVLEIAQALFTESRSAEWGDMLANFTGAFVAAACGIFLGVRAERHRRE